MPLWFHQNAICFIYVKDAIDILNKDYTDIASEKMVILTILFYFILLYVFWFGAM